MKRMHSLEKMFAVALLACATPLALAQGGTGTQDAGMQHSKPGMSGMSGMSHDQMMGEHSMSGTVTEVTSEGMVTVKTGHGTLVVHFPNASQNLKKGDKITVHLGYTKDG